MTLWFERNQIQAGSSAADASLVVEAGVNELGLERFAYVMARCPRGFPIDLYSTVMTSYPPQWVERYIEQDYLPVDPVIGRAARETRPFLWTASSDSTNRRRRRLEAESRDFGIVHGVAVPVRDVHGAVGVFAAVAGDEGPVREAAARDGERLLAAAWDTHEFAVRLARGQRDGDDGGVRLTARERECLLWTLEGKTAQEVATILRLSVYTVNRHVHRAARKLGSLNKYHAAVQAFRGGLI